MVNLTKEQKTYVNVLYRREMTKYKLERSFANIAREYMRTNPIAGVEDVPLSCLGILLCADSGVDVGQKTVKIMRRRFDAKVKPEDDGKGNADGSEGSPL